MLRQSKSNEYPNKMIYALQLYKLCCPSSRLEMCQMFAERRSSVKPLFSAIIISTVCPTKRAVCVFISHMHHWTMQDFFFFFMRTHIGDGAKKCVADFFKVATTRHMSEGSNALFTACLCCLWARRETASSSLTQATWWCVSLPDSCLSRF